MRSAILAAAILFAGQALAVAAGPATATPDLSPTIASGGPTGVNQQPAAKLLYERGYEYIRKADYDSAIECFAEGLRIDPTSEEVLIGGARMP